MREPERPATELRLASGARARVRGPAGGPAAVLLGGGLHAPLRGTWSATVTELARGLGARLPALRTVKVRDRVMSTRRLESCRTDARAAVAAVAQEGPLALAGFSMGGAVAIAEAAAAGARVVAGLAPWVPEHLALDGLAGRRVRIVQGTLDSDALGLPGVSPSSSRAALRLRAAGADADLVLARGATHGLAVPLAPGRRERLPRAERMLDAVAETLAEALGSEGVDDARGASGEAPLRLRIWMMRNRMPGQGDGQPVDNVLTDDT